MFYAARLICSAVRLMECWIGAQPTFAKIAWMEIGIYVIIKTGNVNRDKIFFLALQWIFFHSVAIVRNPTRNINPYI